MALADIWVAIPPAGAADGRPAQTSALGLAAATLSNHDNTGVVSWLWTLVDAPPTSTAALSATNVASPTLGPLDAYGTYWLRLQVNGASGDWLTDAEVDEIVIRVPDALGVVYPAPWETVQGGTDGWADWLTGMNKALSLLGAARTLQADYNGSSPARILLSAAQGPVVFRGQAGVTALGQWEDTGGAARAVLSNVGLFSLTPLAGTGSAGLSILGNNNAALMRLRDTVLKGDLRWYGTGKTEEYMLGALAAGATMHALSADLADVDARILSYFGGTPPLDVWCILGCGAIERYPGANAVLDAGVSRVWDLLSLNYAGNIPNGRIRVGRKVDSTGIVVDAGGTLYGYVADLSGTVNGLAVAYQAWCDTQAQPAYRVKYGIGGTPFVGYCRFGVADAVPITGASQWALSAATATGGASSWAASAGSVFLLVPLHFPPGSTISDLVLHVKPGGAVKLTIYLLSNDALWGASADQQHLLGSAQSDGTGNEQDVSLTGLAVAVPRGEATIQQAYYLVLESAQAGDTFYCGSAKFTYTELLLGE